MYKQKQEEDVIRFYNFGRYIGRIFSTQRFIKDAEQNGWKPKEILEGLEVEQNGKRRPITKGEYRLLRLGGFPVDEEEN